jgi:hypothetical protein
MLHTQRIGSKTGTLSQQSHENAAEPNGWRHLQRCKIALKQALFSLEQQPRF